MNTLFGFIMYMIFGKRWIRFEMLHGLKSAMFVHQADIEMQVASINQQSKLLTQLQEDLKKLETTTLKSADEILPEDQRKNPDAVFNAERKIKGERAEQISTFKNRIESTKNEIQNKEQELSKVQSMAYKTRLKFDFVKNYKIKPTYGDKNFGK